MHGCCLEIHNEAEIHIYGYTPCSIDLGWVDDLRPVGARAFSFAGGRYGGWGLCPARNWF